jgi:hypothetical protein
MTIDGLREGSPFFVQQVMNLLQLAYSLITKIK